MNIYKLILFVLLTFITSHADAHSVQVQYCVNCNGDLRLWIEHWHDTEDASATTMTISLNVGGTVTTQTSTPGGSVQNMTPGVLPGCSTPITYAAGCPGEQNTYNDWVYYDFIGIPQNIPITFTIISGNTVFTEDGCNMYPLSVNFTIAGVGQIDNQDVCSGEVTSSINLPGNAVWTNDNPGIGIPASGTGPITAFTPVGSVGTTANINYSYGCGNGTFSYVIQPSPTPASTSSSGGVNTSESCLGTPFNFIDNSTVPAPYIIDGWLWDFGDGNTSTLQDPSHTYATPGNYTVTFTTESDIGCGSSTTFPVVVNSIPVANFSSDIVCANTITTFDDLSTVANSTITNWTWDILNDNTTEYVIQNPTNTFIAGGIYDVSLVVQSAVGCTSPEVIHTVDVNYIPIPGFITDSVCIGDITTITDTSSVTNATIINWDWQFGDGNIGTGTPATNNYPNTGDFTATLEVTSSVGCTASATGNVYIRALPIADFSIAEACYYNDVTTNNLSTIGTGTMNYSWDFGDLSVLNNSTDPSHNYASSGVYNVNLTATSNFGCVHSSSHSVNVYDKPNADFTVANVCLNVHSAFNDNSSIANVINSDVISDWKWDINADNSFEYITQNPQHLFPSEGGFSTTLITTTAFGCKDTVNFPVDVWPLPQVNFDFIDLCLNDITNFNDLSSISNTYTINSIAKRQLRLY
jgi:PKD repeat protein